MAFIRNADGKVVPNQGLARNITVDQAESIRIYLNDLFQSSKGNKGATNLINLFKESTVTDSPGCVCSVAILSLSPWLSIVPDVPFNS